MCWPCGAPPPWFGLGSVLNHALLHQTVIGREAQKQMALAGDYPDYVYGCHGGGSNFGGLALPFVGEALKGRPVTATGATRNGPSRRRSRTCPRSRAESPVKWGVRRMERS